MRVVLGSALAVAFLVSRSSLLIQTRSFSFPSTQSLRVRSSGSQFVRFEPNGERLPDRNDASVIDP